MPSGSSRSAPELRSGEVQVWTVALPGRDRGLARLALRTILGRYLDLPAGAVPIETEPAGKPYLPGAELQFSLSHSRDLALIAVSAQVRVGVDLEHERDFRSADRLARRICSEREYAALQAASDDGRLAHELLRLWVRKEAVVKGIGEGLGRPLREVDVLDDAVSGGWLCLDLPEPAAAFKAAVAAQADRVKLSAHRFAWE
jgi:4'-phosphopantetheinyl transferase